jgi:hypothetical protein
LSYSGLFRTKRTNGRTQQKTAQPDIACRVRWGGIAFACLAILSGTAILFRFDPAASGFYPFCVFYRTTGLLCPGCGSLRAFHHLLHGDWVEAVRYNPLLVASFPLLIWLGVRLAGIALGKEVKPIAIKPRWLWGGFAVLAGFGILRNLPLPPLAWFHH